MGSEGFEVPKWAAQPPSGMHLDVFKDDKLTQKLMLDEKKCYFFGRNPSMNDFCIDHSSCSRVHAALVYHKLLQRFFLIDLSSTHGTFVGSLRLEANKPTQLPLDTDFHFGASTRRYILREKPIAGKQVNKSNSETDSGSVEQDVALPESELELDNLTEYNTANNKRVSVLAFSDKPLSSRKRKLLSVSFKEDEDIINPEDIDPSVGKFRNLIQTAVIPNKRVSDTQIGTNAKDYRVVRPDHSDVDSTNSPFAQNPLFSHTVTNSLGIHCLNPAPQVGDGLEEEACTSNSFVTETESAEVSAEKKKKYAKESWPGRKSGTY